MKNILIFTLSMIVIALSLYTNSLEKSLRVATRPAVIPPLPTPGPVLVNQSKRERFVVLDKAVNEAMTGYKPGAKPTREEMEFMLRVGDMFIEREQVAMDIVTERREKVDATLQLIRSQTARLHQILEETK